MHFFGFGLSTITFDTKLTFSTWIAPKSWYHKNLFSGRKWCTIHTNFILLQMRNRLGWCTYFVVCPRCSDRWHKYYVSKPAIICLFCIEKFLWCRLSEFSDKVCINSSKAGPVTTFLGCQFGRTCYSVLLWKWKKLHWMNTFSEAIHPPQIPSQKIFD